MTLQLDLPPQLEQRLLDRAGQEGQTPSGYALSLLEQNLELLPVALGAKPNEVSTAEEPLPTNGAELVAYWQRHGLIGDWAGKPGMDQPDIYCENLRRAVERRDGASE